MLYIGMPALEKWGHFTKFAEGLIISDLFSDQKDDKIPLDKFLNPGLYKKDFDPYYIVNFVLILADYYSSQDNNLKKLHVEFMCNFIDELLIPEFEKVYLDSTIVRNTIAFARRCNSDRMKLSKQALAIFTITQDAFTMATKDTRHRNMPSSNRNLIWIYDIAGLTALAAGVDDTSYKVKYNLEGCESSFNLIRKASLVSRKFFDIDSNLRLKCLEKLLKDF